MGDAFARNPAAYGPAPAPFNPYGQPPGGVMAYGPYPLPAPGMTPGALPWAANGVPQGPGAIPGVSGPYGPVAPGCPVPYACPPCPPCQPCACQQPCPMMVFPNHPYARSPRDFFMLD
jgi:hypothetical protein